MRLNKLRELLRAGKPTLGTRVMSPWPTVIEVLGQARQYDYVEFLAEYAPSDLHLESWQSSWNIVLPLSEEDRLRHLYEGESSHSPPRLDLIILTGHEIDLGLSPSRDDFVLEYENTVFQVWVRRGLLSK